MPARGLHLLFVLLGSLSPACYGWHVDDVAFGDARLVGESGETEASIGTFGEGASGPENLEADDSATDDHPTESSGPTGHASTASDDSMSETESTGGTSGGSGEAGDEDPGTASTTDDGSADELETSVGSDGDSSPCGHDRGYWRQHHANATAPKKQIPWPLPEDGQLCGRSWLELLWEPNQGSTWRVLAQACIVVQLNLALGVESGDATTTLEDSLTLVDHCELPPGEEARAAALTEALTQEINWAIHQCD